MVSFGSLPGEIILSIIALVTPLSIRRCRQVSRFLKNLVDEDHYIQYLLELDAHGYVQPSHPRRDLNYAGKLEILRDHVMMWNQLGNNPPHFYKIPFGEQVTMHAFSKGVFAWGVRYGESYAAHQIHLYRFASRNRGTSFSNQVFSYPTIKVAAFFMDVDQDLLVLIEESPGQTFQTHSRLLSTNEPHPKAALCESVITHTYTLPNVSDRDDLMIEIANHSLAVLLPGPHYDPGLRVDVWDWTTGQQLSCLNISGTQGLLGCLLSENLLAICKPSIPFDPDTHPCIGKSGSLDVYRFSLHPVVPLAPVIAASFKLPCQKSSRTEYIIAAQNGITHPGSHIPNNGFAQAYSLASHNRILRILVCSSNAITQTCLFSMSTIFDMLPKCQIEDYPTDHLVIPWADWAQYTYWPIGTDPEFIPHFGRSTGLSGQRAAGIQSGRDDCLITVLDIDQCRMRSRSMPGVEPFGDVCVSESNVMHRDWRDDGEPPGSNDWMPIKSYAQKTFSIELDWRTLKEVMIDDEYVVVMAIHTHDSFKRELHVYSL